MAGTWVAPSGRLLGVTEWSNGAHPPNAPALLRFPRWGGQDGDSDASAYASMSDKRPAFQWYPKDYLSDERVALMSLEQEGAYRRLLDYCWLQGSIPSDLTALGRLCRVDGERMATLWPEIAPCFTLRDGRYIHKRLEAEIRRQDEWAAKSAAGGRESARQKALLKGGSTNPQAAPLNQTSTLQSAVCSLPLPEKQQQKKPPSGVKKAQDRRIQLPDAWTPTAAHVTRATAEHLDLARESERFRSHHLAKGSRFVSWDQAFTTWLLNAVQFARNGTGKPAPLARTLRTLRAEP